MTLKAMDIKTLGALNILSFHPAFRFPLSSCVIYMSRNKTTSWIPYYFLTEACMLNFTVTKSLHEKNTTQKKLWSSLKCISTIQGPVSKKTNYTAIIICSAW